MLNFVAWISAGGLLGWLASRLVAGSLAPSILLNIMAGVVGGFVSGLVVQSVLSALDPQTAQFSLWALGSALSGASDEVSTNNVTNGQLKFPGWRPTPCPPPGAALGYPRAHGQVDHQQQQAGAAQRGA